MNVSIFIQSYIYNIHECKHIYTIIYIYIIYMNVINIHYFIQ